MGQQGDFSGQPGFQDQSGLGNQPGYDNQRAYQGNTTDSNTFGTGDIGGGGRREDQQRGSGDNFNQSSQQGYDNNSSGNQGGFGGNTSSNDNYNNDSNDFGSGGRSEQQHNKPSMGDKLKGMCLLPLYIRDISDVFWTIIGGMEKIAGKVTGNEGMVERGQERKVSLLHVLIYPVVLMHDFTAGGRLRSAKLLN